MQYSRAGGSQPRYHPICNIPGSLALQLYQILHSYEGRSQGSNYLTSALILSDSPELPHVFEVIIIHMINLKIVLIPPELRATHLESEKLYITLASMALSNVLYRLPFLRQFSESTSYTGIWLFKVHPEIDQAKFRD